MDRPLPSFYDPVWVGQVGRVSYQERAIQARQWGIAPAIADSPRVALLLVDVQNTFCLPAFELYVAGAIADNQRLCSFIYRHLHRLTTIFATLDSHSAIQIFHSDFWRDAQGNPPPPLTVITLEDWHRGRWRVNPAIAPRWSMDVNAHAEHYLRTLATTGRDPLTIWPYHAMIGGIGHALVAAVEEAIFCHGIARQTVNPLILKGHHPLTENYSALGPEVKTDVQGTALGGGDPRLDSLLTYDAVIIAGQAKSHCVAATIADLLDRFAPLDRPPTLYLLEDCTSPVVVPGVVDYTHQANAAFDRFEAAGARRLRSGDPWPF